jgi:hypothetical protein
MPHPWRSPGARALDANLFPTTRYQTFININLDGAEAAADLQRRRQRHVYYAGTTQGALAVMPLSRPRGSII